MTISINNRLDQFKQDCKIINLKYEYTGYKDDVQWAIVTELSEEEILQKYPEEIKPYIPFIRLSVSQGEVFEEGARYENKYRMREMRTGHIFNVTDDDFELYHPELIINDTEDKIIRQDEAEKLQVALSTLLENQKNRVYKYFFCQMSYTEIARDEGVDVSSVRKTIEKAIKKLKKFYENHPN
ncbi:MAG: sigma-70 family RNA polymerase sigma factor [Clostridia bacterium]|nr:sigma-70 family RNA polymerase sigma factor [Clostridia bacterium]